ncbi:MAG TPA: membrane bound O-acyl transferase family-domain-containing protein [Ohtaekwangia sp.]|nr:membrane bound O-acyl transferase family-domain-containing protein [Ohtaekwangia sp.]
MKMLVVLETYSYQTELTRIQWAAFCLGWFGMRPALFEMLPNQALPFAHLLWKGISRMAAGVILLYASMAVEQNADLEKIFIPQLLLLAGLSLILHFGILNLSAAVWRRLGVNVSELFRSPYKSKSLKEFWGKRWNIAFSEMTTRIAFRPLKSLVGKEKALIASFLLSGVLHEIAISFPVNAGFGLPMIYFAIHALAMYLESHAALVQQITQHRWWSHVWVVSLLVIPMPLLFHHEFMQQVLFPLRNFILQMITLA